MKASCWQNHFLLLRSTPARQAGYAGALAGRNLSDVVLQGNRDELLNACYCHFSYGWTVYYLGAKGISSNSNSQKYLKQTKNYSSLAIGVIRGLVLGASTPESGYLSLWIGP